MDEEFLAKHDKAIIQSKVNALKAVTKMDLPKAVTILDNSFSGLGLKIIRDACKNMEQLRKVYGDKLPYLIGLSLRETWFSLFDGSGYIAQMIADGGMCDNHYTRRLATAEGYGENEGIAWTLYNQLNVLVESRQQATFRDDTPFDERLPIGDILAGVAMYWFVAAADSYRAGDVVGAFDWLSEALDALSLANGNRMFDQGVMLERESVTESYVNAVSAARTALAKAAAQARHRETRNMKLEVFDWLDAHMTEFKSMDAAAQAIVKQQPIVFRTACDWVGDWKKLRSAGTP